MPADQLADTISGTSIDECALMDRIAAGDPSALETLYYSFHPNLARFLSHTARRSSISSQQRSSSAGSDMRHPLEQTKDASDDAELSDALSQGVRAVPFEQRLALLLTYQMGYGLEEVAAITGVSAATVSARMLCARAKLRCRLPALVGAGIAIAAVTDIHHVSNS
jgi:RNA polymerase sigma factor (sigma-70 family)